jgi:hypothetical protein
LAPSQGSDSRSQLDPDNLGAVSERAARLLRSLNNRRFRGLLVIWAGVPIGLFHLWGGLLQPMLFGAYLGDFQESYIRAAGRLAAGMDPYDLCQTAGCLEPTGPQYVMPPLLAWLLQPVIRIDPHEVAVVVIIFLNAFLVLYLWCAMRALRVRDWQLAALLVMVSLTFAVTGNIDEGQVNLVLLGLSGLWLWAWVDGVWWGGVALGAAVAIKLIQAPVGVLLLVARRWSMLAAAIATGLVVWLVAAPQYLVEYLFKVLPQVSAGTGLFENQSPGGTVTRLLEPDTFFGAVHGSPPAARLITLLIALAALGLTLWVLRKPAAGETGRALEAAAIVAVTPLVVSYSWGTHLVLLQLPLLVLITWCIRRRDWMVLGLVAAGYLLITLGHHELQVLLVNGYSNLFVLRVLAECAVAGILAIWLSTLLAVRRERSGPGIGPALRSDGFTPPNALRNQPRLGAEHHDPSRLP